MAASLTAVKPEQALCMATGNTAKAFGLDTGFIREGLAADFAIMDAPMGSVGKDALQAIAAGDVPGISMVIVDSKTVAGVSRNTPPAVRKAKVV
jgi:enamidase